MRWREMLIGAAITLVVTVIGGVIVFYFTQEREDSRERIVYELGEQISFEGSNEKASIGSLSFINAGKTAASNVTAKLYVAGAEIIDFNIKGTDNPDLQKTVSEDRRTVDLRVKLLLPGERISATFLLNQEGAVNFSIRSDGSIGELGSTYIIERSGVSVANEFAFSFVPILSVFAAVASLLALKLLKKSSLEGGGNNTAFVLLHKNSVEDALAVLERAINDGEGGSHVLSNYAAALSLNGNHEKSRRYMDAAMFLASTKHEKAVCHLNEAILLYCLGDFDGARKQIEMSISLSKSEIVFYLKNSDVFQGFFRERPDLKVNLQG